MDSVEALAAALLSPSLRVTTGEHGLSVNATQDIKAGERLVHVPASYTITADRVLQTPTLSALLSRETEAHISIAAWLMLQTDQTRHEKDGRTDSHSMLRTYIHTLSRADIDCTLLWTDDEINALQRSRSAQKARQLQAWSAEAWSSLSRHPESPWRIDLPGTNASYHLARFRWSLCAVWSRSFQLRCLDETCGGAAGASSGGVWRVLVPGADLFNHDANVATAGLDVRAEGGMPERWHHVAEDDDSDGTTPASDLFDGDADADAFNIRATRAIPAGSEITLDYGPRSNADLLTTHGFALLDNAAESLPLSLSAAPNDEAAAVKAMILKEGNLSAPYMLSPSALTSDSDLLVALRIQYALPSELTGSRWKDAFAGRPLSARNERKWRGALRGIVEGMLRDYEGETTAAEDRDLLATLSSTGRMSLADKRFRAAIVTRLGEKDLLRRVLGALDQLRVQAAAVGVVGGEVQKEPTAVD